MKRKTKTCDKCNLNYSLSCFSRHYKKCDSSINYWKKINLGISIVDNTTTCKFCNKTCKNANSQRNHSRLCKLNPNKQKTFFETNKNDIRIKNQKNQYVKARELGLPKPKISEETRKKLSSAVKSRNKEFTTKIGRKISKTIKNKVTQGKWHCSLARKMHYNYKNINLHGTWELKYAQFLDQNNILWERCKNSFSYVFENEKRRYTPDFYLPQSDEYVEIKGYKTKKDEAKWEQFPKKIVILREDDLKKMGVL